MVKKFRGLGLGIAFLALGLTLTACGKNTSKDQNQTSDKKTQIVVATDGNTKPFTYTVDGKATGYDVELARKVFEKLPEYDLKVDVTDFDAISVGIDSGRYQMGANNFAWNEKRDEKYYFSYPVSKTNNAVATRVGDNVSTIDDLANKSTEVSTGVNYTDILLAWNKEHPDKEIKLNYVDNIPLATRLGNIESKKIDFLLYDAISLNTVIKEQGFKLQVNSIDLKEDLGVHSGREYFLFAKTDEGRVLQEKVNKILAEFEADGTLKKLSEEFFAGDFVPDASEFK
ncbi:transporter substrate-binding domain-containing protein [Streptococcaceae bacterium ESL0729]|nr:transporter substrate-binding domain-containing protein [Streptococcaceae bacterium ESL0729]